MLYDFVSIYVRIIDVIAFIKKKDADCFTTNILLTIFNIFVIINQIDQINER